MRNMELSRSARLSGNPLLKEGKRWENAIACEQMQTATTCLRHAAAGAAASVPLAISRGLRVGISSVGGSSLDIWRGLHLL